MDSIEKELAYLTRGVEECLPVGDLAEKLKKSRADKKPLRVKVGFDPTAPDLHLGHTVLMQKMRHFQDMGHEVVFLVGDFTALIGDPSGRNSARPPLSPAEIEKNAATYTEQAFKILNRDSTIIRRNSEWLGAMSAADIVRLTARHTVARMLERDDFSKRMKAQQPISIHEFLYPLMQGYDSLALEADVELGGTDQKFNLLVGRELQRQESMDGQCIMTVPLLEGLDGKMKMSKSVGNHIGVTETAEEIYGKTMSLSDELMWRYYELLSTRSTDEIAAMHSKVEEGSNPKFFKDELAYEFVVRFHGEDAAKNAADIFNSRVVRGEVPDEMPTITVKADADGLSPPLFYLLKTAGLVDSSSDGKRFISQGAVKIDGKKAIAETRLRCGDTVVVQVGKRRFARIKIEKV